jgi:hypothetical protein
MVIIPNSHRNSKSPSSMLLVVDVDHNTYVCSSTVTEVEVYKCGPSAPPGKKQHRRPRVRFNEDANETYLTTRKEECIDRWYSAIDYRDFKAYNRYLVRQISKQEQVNRSASIYNRTLLRTYEACRECTYDDSLADSALTSTDERQLKRLMQLSTSRVGLERSCVKAIQQDRVCRRQEIVQVVMEIQDEMAQSETLMCLDARDQYLRQACEFISRPSRMFARQLAQAQAPENFFQKIEPKTLFLSMNKY